MRILLDTIVFMRAHFEPELLSEATHDVLNSPEHRRYLSAATSIEISLLSSRGRFPSDIEPAQWVPERMRRSFLQPLGIEHIHALQLAILPLHHRDPFDRILVAQAQLERLAVLTSDAMFERYDVEVIRA